MASLVDKVSDSAADAGAAASQDHVSERLRSLMFAKDAGQHGERRVPVAPRRRRRRFLFLGALVLATIVLGARRYVGLFQNVAEVDVVSVESQLSAATVLDTSGYLMAKTKVLVNSKIPGTIVELPIDEGAKVQERELLARLDGDEYAADLAAAKAGLAQTRARLSELEAGARPEEIRQAQALLDQANAGAEFARQDFERAKRLKNTISDQEFERAKANFEEAQASADHQTHTLALLKKGARPEQISAARADVERAQANVDKAAFWYESTKVLSPITGTVLERQLELGERIGPEVIGAGICVVANLDEMEVEVDVQERELVHIQVGQPCRIEPEAYPNRLYKGRVSRIMPVANRQRGVVQIRVEVLNDDSKLLPEMNCRIVVLREGSSFTPDDRLRVPKVAVLGQPDDPYVFVIDGNFARKRPVKLGAEHDGAMIVKEGVFAGEQVILPLDPPLSDGQPVRKRAVENAG
ncbi:MAG: efflux RND transporter periplasmic adaptor subunit [Pirellulales bacterium]